MILGFDHLARTVTHLDEEMARLQARGWHTAFMARNLANPREKSPLLGQFQPLHSLAWCAPPPDNGVALELVQHGEVAMAPPGPYHPEQDGTITLSVAHVALESDFWRRGLGFQVEGEQRLVLRRPLPSWCCVVTLKENKAISPAFLDSSGHPCLALLSSDAMGDLDKALRSGANDPVGPFVLSPNEKPLRITLFRTPSGAICEFIQPLGK